MTGPNNGEWLTGKWAAEEWVSGEWVAYNQQYDSISVQALFTLKTRAKDNQGKTYWIYPSEDVF